MTFGGRSWYNLEINNYIESRANKCGGKPCIAGTRIRVQDIYVWHELQHMSPDDIVNDFPELSLAEVHAALTYFWDNQESIRQQMREDGEFVKQIQAVTGPGPLETKLREETDAQSDSVSS